MNNSDKDKIIGKILKSGGTFSKNDLEKAAGGDMSGVFSKLNKEDSERIKQALSSPEKAKQLLSSDAATKLIQSLLGKDKNGRSQ